MRNLVTSISVIAATAGGAFAGGLDRTGQPINALFEQGGETGSYLELSFANTNPSLSGEGIYTGHDYKNVGNSFWNFGGAIKAQFSDQLSGALIFDQPFGADVEYGGDPGSTELGGTSALAETFAITALLRYEFSDRWSAHGGIRVQRANGDIMLSGLAYGLPEATAQSTAANYYGLAQQAASDAAAAAAAGDLAAAAQYQAQAVAYGEATTQAAGTANGYKVNLKEDWAVGYVIGGAFEIPEIAARVSLTYNSAITHDMETKESGPEIFGLGSVYDGASSTEVKTPQSVVLDLQTGIAEDTLLFGSVRWVDWSEFRIDPENFVAVTGSGLVELKDTTTYQIGVGRRFNEQWSGSIAVSYEAESDKLVSPLAPTNGLYALALGASYDIGDMSISGGARYTWLGDAHPETGTPDVARADFTDNNAVSLGLRIGYEF